MDLRLDATWPELLEFTEEFNTDTLDSFQHNHIPAIVLLIKYIKMWQNKVALLMCKKIESWEIPDNLC